MVSRYVDIEVDLDEFGDDYLIEELKDRGYYFPTENVEGLVEEIFEKRRNKKNFERELDDLIYLVIGRIST